MCAEVGLQYVKYIGGHIVAVVGYARLSRHVHALVAVVGYARLSRYFHVFVATHQPLPACCSIGTATPQHDKGDRAYKANVASLLTSLAGSPRSVIRYHGKKTKRGELSYSPERPDWKSVQQLHIYNSSRTTVCTI